MHQVRLGPIESLFVIVITLIFDILSYIDGLPADIWSLGMMFYELIFGGLIKPLRDSYQRRLLQALDLSGMLQKGHDQLLVSFFGACFKSMPEDRPSIEELEEHPLFKDYNMSQSMAAVGLPTTIYALEIPSILPHM